MLGTITATDLRAHYGAEEFAVMTEDHLSRAIARAESTIGRYLTALQQIEIGAGALGPVVLTLSRAYAHDEQALTAEHPVVREMNEALQWLRSQYDRLAIRTDTAATQAHIGITVMRGPPSGMDRVIDGMLP